MKGKIGQENRGRLGARVDTPGQARGTFLRRSGRLLSDLGREEALTPAKAGELKTAV